MKTNFKGELLAEENEGITNVEWLGKKQIAEALKNSYANIKILI